MIVTIYNYSLYYDSNYLYLNFYSTKFMIINSCSLVSAQAQFLGENVGLVTGP